MRPRSPHGLGSGGTQKFSVDEAPRELVIFRPLPASRNSGSLGSCRWNGSRRTEVSTFENLRAASSDRPLGHPRRPSIAIVLPATTEIRGPARRSASTPPTGQHPGAPRGIDMQESAPPRQSTCSIRSEMSPALTSLARLRPHRQSRPAIFPPRSDGSSSLICLASLQNARTRKRCPRPRGLGEDRSFGQGTGHHFIRPQQCAQRYPWALSARCSAAAKPHRRGRTDPRITFEFCPAKTPSFPAQFTPNRAQPGERRPRRRLISPLVESLRCGQARPWSLGRPACHTPGEFH